MPMYHHLKNVPPLFAGEQGFYDGKRAEELLRQGAIKLVETEAPRAEYEDRQMTEPPVNRMLTAKAKPKK